MVKSSAAQQLKIVIVYLIFGVGIGIITSMALALGRVVPDTMGFAFLVVIPITLLYLFFRLFREFNKVIIGSTDVTVISFLGKKKVYPFDSTEFSFAIGGYKAYGAKYAPVLHMAVMDTGLNKSKKYRLSPYNEKQILEIIDLLTKNSH